MRNPEDRSPQEWAEMFHEDVTLASDLPEDSRGIVPVRELTTADCDELAQRMDDLAEALRLLRGHMTIPAWKISVDALLAKYEEDRDDE